VTTQPKAFERGRVGERGLQRLEVKGFAVKILIALTGRIARDLLPENGVF